MKNCILVILISFICFSCKKESSPAVPVIPAELPVVTTKAIFSITSETANTGGVITSDGGGTITAKGICWDTLPNPTIANHHNNNGTGMSEFTSKVIGLTANTTYYVRAYATNGRGTGYGNELSFNTTDPKVYVVGYENNRARLWTNNIASNVSSGSFSSDARSVFVLNSDVYITGTENNGTTDYAKVWKNGEVNSITTGSNSGGNTIFVDGTDVYVGGYVSSYSTI